MHRPEDYILDALEIVSAWDLPNDAAVAAAANQQARLMAGCFDHDESRGDVSPESINIDQH